MSIAKILSAAVLVASVTCAQQFSNAFAPVVGFVDISTTGGTQIIGVGDDTTHAITTTIGNAMFPAGSVTIGNNGVASAIAPASGPFTNYDIPTGTAVPTGLTAAAQGILLPHWDDLYPASSGTSIWWQEAAGVLIIMWKDENHYADLTAGAGITFQVQVFDGAAGSCTPIIQYLYSDTVFGGAQALNDNGASATIGYAKGSNPATNNAKWSFDTVGSVSAGLCLTIIEGSGGPFSLTASSPFGTGSLQLDFANGFPCLGGTYFLAVTLYAGSFPNGWLYGLDIPFSELQSELAAGFPFMGPIGPTGTYTLGPFTGLPSGLPLYMLGFGTPTGGVTPTLRTSAISYVIP